MVKRIGAVVVDGLVVAALLYPAAFSFVTWVLAAIYLLLSRVFILRMRGARRMLDIMHDRDRRVIHGLEHATITLLERQGVEVVHGFTWSDRFVVALRAGQQDRRSIVHTTAAAAVRRVRDGERSLAYSLRCSTSQLAFAITIYAAVVVSAVVAVALGRSGAIVFAVGIVVFRLWGAWEQPLGLLAQRLYTVTPAFTSGNVTSVQVVTKSRGCVCPDDETWFEVVVDIRPLALRGGLVAPGPLM